MIGRQHSGVIASVLALSLMACAGSPLATNKTGSGGPKGGASETPSAIKPSPVVGFEPPDRSDEPVMEPIQGLDWNLMMVDSPRDQRVGRVHGALRGDGGYRFFLQQGDHFYARTVYLGGGAPQWTQLASHFGKSPTRLFSDGDRLFFVNLSGNQLFEVTSQACQPVSGLPSGIVAVAGGPGFAFAATSKELFHWNGAFWKRVVDLPSRTLSGERFLSLAVDTSGGKNDLIITLSETEGQGRAVKILPPAAFAMDDAYPAMKQVNLSFVVQNLPSLVLRSDYRSSGFNSYRFWGLGERNHMLMGLEDGGGALGYFSSDWPYEGAFESSYTFLGLVKQMGRFYAFRPHPAKGPEVFYLTDSNITARWQAFPSRKVDGGDLKVTLTNENSMAVDGSHLYLAGSEGLFRYRLDAGIPYTYSQGVEGWRQETVELSAAPATQVVYCGDQPYVETPSGTYTKTPQGWVLFELGGLPARLVSSIYGHAAVVARSLDQVDYYLFLNGNWQLIERPLPDAARPKADNVFFSQGRLYVTGEVSGREAVYQRSLDTSSNWMRAAPPQTNFQQAYISDGSNLLAISSSQVRVASLAEQFWKAYPSALVQPDGSVNFLNKPSFETPIAVTGYAFAWVNAGGSEHRLCRATSVGWKPLVNNKFEGMNVSLQLSTDGHYLYSTASEGGVLKEVIRLPIKDGQAWERVPSLRVGGKTLAEAKLTVNGPVFLDRDRRKAYLPTSRGVVGSPP